MVAKYMYMCQSNWNLHSNATLDETWEAVSADWCYFSAVDQVGFPCVLLFGLTDAGFYFCYNYSVQFYKLTHLVIDNTVSPG